MTLRLIASAVIAALLLAGNAPAVPQDQGKGAIPAQPQRLTQAEAQAAALAHAGLTQDQVTELKSHPDRDGRVRHWDVEFRQGDWEFDYELHMETGAILEWDKEYDPAKRPAQPKPAQPAPTQTKPAQPEPAQELTAAEARAIALQHAGLSAGEVRGLKAEKDFDRGGWQWEVEFRAGGWEYDYDISAQTGAILEWDKEFDD